MIRHIIAAATLTVPAAVLFTAAPSNADPGCQTQPWGFLGSQTRIICDSPMRPDGSWMRSRVIGIPAHYRNASSSCSGGAYYSNCTYYPAGWVDNQISDNETYPVTPDTVLPDEPGYLGPSAYVSA